MKKILIVIDNLCGGGAEKVLTDVLLNINRDKYDIDVLLINKIGVYIENLKEFYNILYLSEYIPNKKSNIMFRKFNTLIFKIKSNLMAGKYFANKLVNNCYDIEISFLEGMSAKFVGNRKNNAKKIAWVHTDLEKHKTINRAIEKRCYNRMDKIVAVSNDSKKSIENLYPNLKNNISVIYNPVDARKITRLSNDNIDDKIYFESNNEVNFISIGRLNKVKGYDILLEVHKQLIEEGYKHNIYILGEGREYEDLNNYINRNNLNDTAHLLGFKKNPYPYLKQSDVFISSSRYEGFSLVIAESMVLGKPIIATSCTGPRELLNDGEFGILAEVESVESLKEAMKAMIISKEKIEYYSTKSLERSSIFDLNKTIKEVENLFDTIGGGIYE